MFCGPMKQNYIALWQYISVLCLVTTKWSIQWKEHPPSNQRWGRVDNAVGLPIRCVSIEGCGYSNRTMTPNTHKKAPRNGSRLDAGLLWSDQRRVQIWITSKTYGAIWKQQLVEGTPQNIEESDQFAAKKLPKLPVERSSKRIDGYKKHLSAVILAVGCATKYTFPGSQ